MPAARKAAAKGEDAGAVFALACLTPRFRPGDRIDGHVPAAAIEILIRDGHASRERPEG